MPSRHVSTLNETCLFERNANPSARFSPFLQLPVELICLTLSYLGMQDLLTCKATSKFLSCLITSNPRLQYIIELAERQMVPSSHPPGMSVAAQRKLLQEREKRWRSLNWKGKHTTRIPGAGSIYEFVGGVYGNGHGTSDDRRVSGSITFHQLPSTGPKYTESDTTCSWTLSNFEMNIIDFSMDPSQDLLVLVVAAPPTSQCHYQVHLRTLSSNKPHPLAPSPVLDCRRNVGPEQFDMWTSFRIQILDQYLALLIKDVFHTSATFVAIWNWRVGASARCSMPLSMGVDDFCFLSRTKFLIVIPRGYLDVYSFKDPAINPEKANYPMLLRRFVLPNLKQGYHYWYISVTANPIPGAMPVRRMPPKSSPQAPVFSSISPFHARPDDGLLACSLGTLNPSLHAQVDCFVFFMRVRAILDAVAVGSTSTLHVPWESWGPRATRWFGDFFSSDWQHAVHGFRTVERVLETQNEPGPGVVQHPGVVEARIRVRDYNPYLIAQEMAARNEAGQSATAPAAQQPATDADDLDTRTPSTVKLVTEASIIPAGDSFVEDIVSCLPYREVTTEKPTYLSDLMLDDSHILCLKREENGQLSSMDILAF